MFKFSDKILCHDSFEMITSFDISLMILNEDHLQFTNFQIVRTIHNIAYDLDHRFRKFILKAVMFLLHFQSLSRKTLGCNNFPLKNHTFQKLLLTIKHE